jgi:Tfp pilus assembly protein PilX
VNSGRRPCSRHDSGQVLLMALMVLLLASIAAALVASSLLLSLRVAREEAIQVQLQALTDAAMAEALASLARDPAFPGAEAHALGPRATGSIWSRVEALAPQRVAVRAGGSYGEHRRSVRADVVLGHWSPRVVSWAVEH